MDYKKSTRNVGGEVGREAVRKPDFGAKRRFLTTVAGAGAIIALLGAGSLAAQERNKEPVKSAWPVEADGANSAEEKKPVQIVNVINVETGRKIIPQGVVERMVKNTENELYIRLQADRYGGPEGIETSSFEYFVYADKEKEEVRVAFKTKTGEFEDSALFRKATAQSIQIESFQPKENELLEDIVVAAGNGRLAVCVQAKNGVSSLVQVSTAMKKGAINMFEDGVEQPVKMVIGYENREGEITIISVPEKPEQGDSVLLMKISKEGAVTSEVLAYQSFKMPSSQGASFPWPEKEGAVSSEVPVQERF